MKITIIINNLNPNQFSPGNHEYITMNLSTLPKINQAKVFWIPLNV